MDIEEILKLPLGERPLELEKLAGWTLIPKEVNKRLFYDEQGKLMFASDPVFNQFFDEYKKMLHSIVFSNERSYKDFKTFLGIFRKMYNTKQYNRLRNMTNQEIDYVLESVRQARVELLEEEINE